MELAGISLSSTKTLLGLKAWRPWSGLTLKNDLLVIATVNLGTVQLSWF